MNRIPFAKLQVLNHLNMYLVVLNVCRVVGWPTFPCPVQNVAAMVVGFLLRASIPHFLNLVSVAHAHCHIVADVGDLQHKAKNLGQVAGPHKIVHRFDQSYLMESVVGQTFDDFGGYYFDMHVLFIFRKPVAQVHDHNLLLWMLHPQNIV